MTDKGETRSSFGEQDHVLPQVFFPSIVTLRDPTYASFLYVLGNLLRNDHYGAQETRTGKVHNHLLATVWTNGEIFSNLRFTQVIYDTLIDRNQYHNHEPLDPFDVRAAAVSTYKELMDEEPVIRAAEFIDPEVEALRREVVSIYTDFERTKELLDTLNSLAQEYAKSHGKKK
jgi:CRISPR-associated protein Csc2